MKSEDELDAARYRYIRDALTQITNIKMDGQHSWRVQAIYTTGDTFHEALDKTMKERPIISKPLGVFDANITPKR